MIDVERDDSWEEWRPWFNQVWTRIEAERGVLCEFTFEDFVEDLDAEQPAALALWEDLHFERLGYYR